MVQIWHFQGTTGARMNNPAPSASQRLNSAPPPSNSYVDYNYM